MNNYVVIDVGGSFIKHGVMNEQGELIKKDKIKTCGNDIIKLIDDIKNIVTYYKREFEVKGLACSFPGAVDSLTGFIGGGSAVECINGVNIKKYLEEATNLEVAIENDANCAALAEGWIGAAKDVDNFVSIVCGTGIGGAIVINKKILKGKNYHGGEFGYMLLTDDNNENKLGPLWSEISSTGALVRRVANIKGIDVKLLDGKQVFDMEKYDNEVKCEIDKWFRDLAKGIYNIKYILDPEKILIGGAISEREDFINRLNSYLSILKNKIATLDIVVEKCMYENDSNLIGALYNFLYCK